MIRITIKFIILFMPILVMIVICVVVGQHVGELYPLNYIAQLQSENREVKYAIIGSRGQHFTYKLKSIAVQQPELVVLGSSRSWYFKDYLSNNCTHYFYNASVSHASINEILPMVEEFVQPDYKPEIILLSLDYPDYNADSNFREKSAKIDIVSDMEHLSDTLKRSIIHVFINPLVVPKLLDSYTNLNLGWQFITEDNPNYYNGDGSYYESYFTDEIFEQELPNYLSFVANGEAQFQYGSQVDEGSLKSLEAILQIATDNEIEVIGFFPPYYTEILTQLENDSRYEYMPIARDAIQHLFEQYDFDVYDFSNIRSFGGSDDEFYDGWHPGEVMSTQIYVQLLRNDPKILAKYSDIDFLEQLIASTSDHYALNVDQVKLKEQQICNKADT